MPTKAPLHRAHEPESTMRASAAERGYDAEWSQFANNYRRENPLCSLCLIAGITRAAQAVDHIVKLRLAPHRKYDLSNLQALCRECHAGKTAKGQ